MEENKELQAVLSEKESQIAELKRRLESAEQSKHQALIEKNIASFKGELEGLVINGQAFPYEVKMYGNPDYTGDDGELYYSASTILGIMSQRPETGITTPLDTPKPKPKKELTMRDIQDKINERMQKTGEEYAIAAIELQRRGEIPSIEGVE